ncbi:MAG TPA: hypothetical protein VNX68_12845 [Nitrosopumilaceae archaeon]|nr:hypothetical protein [Nitrosopumilaceae archaeon]
MSKILSYTGITGITQLVTQFYGDKYLQTEIKRILNYKEYTQDVVQDIILQLLTSDKQEELVFTCKEGRFHFWVYNVIKSQRNNKQSKTNKQYNSINNTELTDNNVTQVENTYTNKIDQEHKKLLVSIIKEELINIDKKNWYNARMFNDYANLKEEYRLQNKKLSFQEFGKIQNINKNSLWEVINKVKNKLKSKLNEHL